MKVRTVIKNSRKELAAAAILIGSFGILLGVAANEYPEIPPCATEDSTGCYWDADTMGNGQGQDVVNP